MLRVSSSKAAAPIGLIACAIFAFGVTGCNSGRQLSKANVDEVVDGMSKKQVESILGPPTSVDNKDLLLLKKTIYVYNQGKDSITIFFKDDKVRSKESTLTR